MSAQPVFWKAMTYGCDNCGAELEFLLEQGCEGGSETRSAVPVPMYAGPCPTCNLGGASPTWRNGMFGRMKCGFLGHVRWNEDRVLTPPLAGETGLPHFRYPTRRQLRDDSGMACGRPVYQWQAA